MANWVNPTITSNYITFVDEVKARDVDAITLQAAGVVNPPASSVKLVRSPVKFQEWNGSAFVDLVLSAAGGGTGVTNIAALVPLLGLGSMAYQNANAVYITGGWAITSNFRSCSWDGSGYYIGSGFSFNSQGGSIPVQINAGPAQWACQIVGPNHGLLIQACSGVKTENAFYVRNAASTILGMYVRGDMGVFCPTGLVIPVGTNKFVPV